LQPLIRRTWAPRGQTPVLRAWDRYDRLSCIGAVTYCPKRRTLSTPFQIHRDHIRTEEAVDFIRQLRNQLRGPLIICWDRWAVHRSATKKIAASKLKRIHFEWLPAYCPELNPVESRWSHAKYGELANWEAKDEKQLKLRVQHTLDQQKDRISLAESFFESAKLQI
jgi:transposase